MSSQAGHIGKVPLVDLNAQIKSLRPEVEEAVARILDTGLFIGGPEVAGFEEEFSVFCGGGGCVGVGNGTDALYLTLRALEIGAGDEVITVPNTFIATAEAITLVGARPVFVDVRKDTHGMDSDKVLKAVSPRTRAILPVHLYGLPVEMGSINEIASSHGLAVVEDCAQAHGAKVGGTCVGRLGVAGCFSFFPAKNLGAFGDGGAVVSNDEALIERVRMLRNHGRREKYLHEMEGINSRLDALQAAVLRVKLRHLEAWNAARRELAAAYGEALEGMKEIQLLRPLQGTEPVWHLYVILADERDSLRAALADQGISTGIHYPVPLHLQPAYASLGYGPGAFPVAEAASERILSLPLYPELPLETVGLIAKRIRDFYGRS